MSVRDRWIRMEQIPTLEEIDKLLADMAELLKDPRLIPRRRILILDSIDDLLDIRASHPSSQNLIDVASPALVL